MVVKLYRKKKSNSYNLFEKIRIKTSPKQY